MCGILAIHNKKQHVEQDKCNAVLDLLKHRGPDAFGFFSEQNVYLGHRRLSVIDLSSQANQPMYSADENLVLVFNGEIYNYKKLFNLLKGKYSFKSSSDTEVLLYGYQEWGLESLLQKLDGMFAFCLFDKKQNQFILARDNFGEKPLYYLNNDKYFAASSQLTALLQGNFIDFKILKQALYYYLAIHYVPGDLTIVDGIKKLLPGHYMIYDLVDGSSRITKYWEVKKDEVKLEFNEAKKLIKEIVVDSVQSKMVSDVPVGAFLSGGLDSSIIVSIMSQLNKNLNTFSIGFKSKQYDESPYSKLVANSFGTNHHHFTFDVYELEKFFPKVIEFMDEPTGDQALLPVYLMSQQARGSVTVALGGEGADELFAGYQYYEQFLGSNSFLQKIKKVMLPDGGSNFINEKKQQTASGFPLISNQELRRKLINYKQSNWWWLEQMELDGQVFDNRLRQAQLFEIKTWLAEDLLMKNDKMTMAHSLELRAPFLNKKLAQLAINLPDEYKIKGNQSKYILRKAFEEDLPREIIERKKQGFNLPMGDWLRTVLDKSMEPLLNSFDWEKYHLNRNAVQEIWQQHLNNQQDNTRLLYSILVYAQWVNHII